ncbi:DUF1010 domain-containing protein [Ottowia pentelensis]|uniref:DUF1010 domain-containing protein n=1 Tax=Ottowia pentelensis TaxID=511108 RepID=A0ABV6PY97_9BURK
MGVLPLRRALPACTAPVSSYFLAASPCAASATSYHSCSAVPLPWRSTFPWAEPVFKSGSPGD